MSKIDRMNIVDQLFNLVLDHFFNSFFDFLNICKKAHFYKFKIKEIGINENSVPVLMHGHRGLLDSNCYISH